MPSYTGFIAHVQEHALLWGLKECNKDLFDENLLGRFRFEVWNGADDVVGGREGGSLGDGRYMNYGWGSEAYRGVAVLDIHKKLSDLFFVSVYLPQAVIRKQIIQ